MLSVDNIPPQYVTARAATMNSNLFSLLSPTRSPFFKPNFRKLAARFTLF